MAKPIGSIARRFAFYGRGTGPIHLDNVFCNGREEKLFHCNADFDASEDGHFKDAGVRCFAKG